MVYYFSFVKVRSSLKGKGLENFEPVKAAALGSTPVLMFVNDYSSQRLLPFSCSGSACKAGKVEMVPQPEKANTIAPLRLKGRRLRMRR